MKNVLWIIVAVIIVAGGAYWYTMSSDSGTMTGPEVVNQGAESPAPGASGTVLEGSGDVMDIGVGGDTAAPMAVEVTYDGSKFSPQEVTIKKGGSVTWKNSSTGKMWVASAQHPTHTVYSDTSKSEHCAAGFAGAKPFDQCKGEEATYTFTFDKAGTHGYHDHINASAFGKVIVTE